MIRLHIVVEGQAEETFVRDILAPHLNERGIFADARCVETSHKKRYFKGKVIKKTFRGGLKNYDKFKFDINQWIKQDQNKDSFFSCMFDLYELPSNFPGYSAAFEKHSLENKLKHLETSLKEDINHPEDKFIPYIQAHEFEALLFSDLQKFDYLFPSQNSKIKKLFKERKKFKSPEEINDNDPPSKRILSIFDDYHKVNDAPIIIEEIGLEQIRKECPHFNNWITTLESLSQYSLELT